jgi:predicted nucleic acid-binding protein
MKLVDTTVMVDHLRGKPAATQLLESLITSGTTVVASELSRFELLAGVRPAEIGQLEAFFGVIGWVPVTEQVARRAGDYARIYLGSHSGIGAADYLIAATADTLAADLLTTNIKHFPMFASLLPPYSSQSI